MVSVTLEEFHRAKQHAQDVCGHNIRIVAEECARIAEAEGRSKVAVLIRLNYCSDSSPASLTPKVIDRDIEGETIERCAQRAEAWGGSYAHGPVHSTRTYIAAAIRAKAQEADRG